MSGLHEAPSANLFAPERTLPLPPTSIPGISRQMLRLGSFLVLASMIGCHSLGLLTNDHPTPKKEVETPVADALPPAPSKYSLRIMPCCFYSDTELKAEDPVFKDLTNLRNQVYNELKLTSPPNALVQVFLFEDEAHYKRYIKAREPNLPDRRAFFIANHRPLGGQGRIARLHLSRPPFSAGSPARVDACPGA